MERLRLAQGSLLMCAVVLIWGAFLPVSKIALALIDPYWLTLLRYGVAALCFLVTLAWIEGRRALRLDGHAAMVWLLGGAGIAAASILVFEGLRLTRPEHGSMILALNPLNIVIWQWLRTGRRPSGATLACIATALVGIGLVITQGELARLYSGGSALGNALTYLASLCWVAFTLGGQRFPRWSPLRYTTLSVCLGWFSIALATVAAGASGHSQPPQWASLDQILWALFFLLFVVSFAAVLFWNMAVARIGPLDASLFANFAPVVTILIMVWQGHRMLPVEMAGAVLVIGALVANNLVNRRLAYRTERLRMAPASSIDKGISGD